MLENLNDFILIILLFTAVFFDVTEKRIPNKITFSTMLVGLILNIVMNGLNGLIFSFYGFLMGLGVFIIPFTLRLMGAGDVKLMASIGVLKGWKFTALSTLSAAIAGIIVVFVYLIYKKRLFGYFRKYFVVLVEIILNSIYFSDRNIVGNKLKKFAYSKENENKENEKLYVPYGLAIALGTLFVLSGNFMGYLLN